MLLTARVEFLGMWRDLVGGFTSECAVRSPAPASAIESIERELHCVLHEELRSLLSETDGIEGAWGLGLIWSVSDIIERNRQLREHGEFAELYMPFDHLLFFADAGNGDYFGHAVLGGKVRKADVFVWNHEDDSRTWIAPSIAKYVEWWLSGQIKV